MKSFDEAQEKLAEDTKKADALEIRVHKTHCFQGEYEGSCKYLPNEDVAQCPANPDYKAKDNE